MSTVVLIVAVFVASYHLLKQENTNISNSNKLENAKIRGIITCYCLSIDENYCRNSDRHKNQRNVKATSIFCTCWEKKRKREEYTF